MHWVIAKYQVFCKKKGNYVDHFFLNLTITIDFDHNNLPVLLKKKEATEWDLMDKSLLLDLKEREEVKDE